MSEQQPAQQTRRSDAEAQKQTIVKFPTDSTDSGESSQLGASMTLDEIRDLCVSIDQLFPDTSFLSSLRQLPDDGRKSEDATDPDSLNLERDQILDALRDFVQARVADHERLQRQLATPRSTKSETTERIRTVSQRLSEKKQPELQGDHNQPPNLTLRVQCRYSQTICCMRILWVNCSHCQMP